jgi:hypothetical protein
MKSVVAGACALIALVGQIARADGVAEHETIARLTAKGSADSLAAAAVLQQFGAESDSGSHPLVARAAHSGGRCNSH